MRSVRVDARSLKSQAYLKPIYLKKPRDDDSELRNVFNKRQKANEPEHSKRSDCATAAARRKKNVRPQNNEKVKCVEGTIFGVGDIPPWFISFRHGLEEDF